MQMDLQEGSLQGRWGLESQTPAEPQGSGEESPVPLPVQLWSGITLLPRPCPTEQPHPELSCTLGRSRGTHSPKESITAHITHCWQGKIDHLLPWHQELLQAVKVMESVVLRAGGTKGTISSEKDGLVVALQEEYSLLSYSSAGHK